MEKENYCSYLYSEINECCKAPPYKFFDSRTNSYNCDVTPRYSLCKYFKIIYARECPDYQQISNKK